MAKRALLENIKAIPYTAGATVNKLNFLSAVLGVRVSAAATLTVTAKHRDTETGTFENVTDPYFVVGSKSVVITADDVADGPVIVNVPLDIEGCKQYIQITPSVSGVSALVLGDPVYAPVK
ncbi:hypothetical protein FACS1894184_14660 [Clostridia bacterium]|nr:hypothetical protein FACS1894184_14660 [Clostridia bacterium]